MNKMNKILLVLGIATSGLTHAAGIGVVDLARVVDNSTYLKQQNANLNQSVKPSTTRLEQLGKELDALRQKAETEGRSMKEADIQKLNQQYQAKLSEFNSTQQSLQTKVQGGLQNMNNTFEARVKQVAEQLRKENNLDYVLNKNAVIASDTKDDLTDKMIQKVNAIK